MRPEELPDLERELRSLLTDRGLRWVLDSVDEAVAEGVLQERAVEKGRRARQPESGSDVSALRGAVDVEDLFTEHETATGGQHHWSSTGGDSGVTVRAYTVRERVLMIIESVQRVLVDLPEAAVLTRQQLAEATEVPQPDIVVKFADEADETDEFAGAAQQRSHAYGDRRLELDPAFRRELSTALDALKREVLA